MTEHIALVTGANKGIGFGIAKHPGPTTTDLNGNMALPGFHDIETVGQKFAALINDGQSHQGEFIELYPIVKED